MRRLSRRGFLLIGRHAAAVSLLNRWLTPIPAWIAATRAFPSVTVSEGTDEDPPAKILQTALEGLGGIQRFIRKGQTVAVKANATWAFPPHTGSSTDPDFLTAVIHAVQEAGAGRIIIMDHCSIEPGADECLRVNGIGKVVKDTGVEYVFADRYRSDVSLYTKIDLPSGRAKQTMRVMKAAVEADVRINLGVAKTHNVTKLSMSLKHMMGFLQFPGTLHSDLIQGIADISTPSAIQAQLHLLEAIRIRVPYKNSRSPAGIETDLTHPQIVSRRNTVIAGTDPVLIDAFGCVTFYETHPEELAHLLRAYETGCGDLDVETALTDGRIRRFKAGEPVMENTPTAAETAVAVVQSPRPKPTATDLPDIALAEVPAVNSAPGGTECATVPGFVSLGSLLNFALIPAAAVVAGLGLAVLRRMRAKLPDRPETGKGEIRQSGLDAKKKNG
jgi:hypothetical protein